MAAAGESAGGATRFKFATWGRPLGVDGACGRAANCADQRNAPWRGVVRSSHAYLGHGDRHG